MAPPITNPVTLEAVKKLLSNAWEIGIIDDFQRESFFSRSLRFHPVLSPLTGGNTFTYQYTRQLSTAKVQTRDINSNYSPDFVETMNESVSVKPIGGTFQMDRLVARSGSNISEIAFQLRELASSTSRYFDQLCLIGDSSRDRKEFDGILKIADSYSRIEDANIDISTEDARKSNKEKFLFTLDKWLRSFDQLPSFIGGNTMGVLCLQAVAREIGVYQTSSDQWGNIVSSYRGIPLIDFGWKVGQSINPNEKMKITSEDIIPTDTNGCTQLVAGRFGDDAIHGISLSNGLPIESWIPNFTGNNVEAVQTGGVEMVGAIVVKKIRSIGVLNGIKVGNGLTSIKGGKN